MGKYTVLPATAADIPDIVGIHMESFQDDTVISNLRVNMDREANRQDQIKWFTSSMANANFLGTAVYIVKEEETGQIVGFGKWQYPVKLTDALKAEKDAYEAEKAKEPLPEGSNVSLCEDFFGQLKEGQRRALNTTEDYFLHVLCVKPSHHRRGIGSLLIKVGLDRADAAGARTYIEASDTGLPLYIRHGWVPTDYEIHIDLKKHGIGEGVIVSKTLMREPKRKGDSREEVGDIGAVAEKDGVEG